MSISLLLLVERRLLPVFFCEAHSQFSLREAVEGQSPPDLDPLLRPYIEWAGDRCRSLYSSEGVPLVVHIPSFLTSNAVVGFQILSAINSSHLTPSCQGAVNETVTAFADQMPPGKGKTRISMGKGEVVYKGRKDEQQGELCITRHWHAIGRKVCNAFTVFLTWF